MRGRERGSRYPQPGAAPDTWRCGTCGEEGLSIAPEDVAAHQARHLPGGDLARYPSRLTEDDDDATVVRSLTSAASAPATRVVDGQVVYWLGICDRWGTEAELVAEWRRHRRYRAVMGGSDDTERQNAYERGMGWQ